MGENASYYEGYREGERRRAEAERSGEQGKMINDTSEKWDQIVRNQDYLRGLHDGYNGNAFNPSGE